MLPKAEAVPGDTSFSAETELLLATVKVHLGTAAPETLAEALTDDLDWDHVETAARRHGILSIVFEQLTEYRDSVPEDTLSTLEAASREIAQRNLFLLEETLTLLEEFGEYGVQVVPYKGPVLGATLYGDISLRQSLDIDLLVRAGDIDRAETLLLDSGYERDERQQRHVRVFGDTGALHHLTFYRSGQGLIVELHRRLTPHWMVNSLRIADLLDSLEKREVQGQSVALLAPENRLLALCVHGTKHNWERLEWLCDVAALVRQHELDWELAMARARVFEVERPVLIGLSLVSELLNVALPDAVTQAVDADAAVTAIAHEMRDWSLDSGSEPQPLQNVRVQLRTLDGRATRLRAVLRLAFVPTAVDIDMVQLPPRLASLYYLVRPVRLAVALLRGER